MRHLIIIIMATGLTFFACSKDENNAVNGCTVYDNLDGTSTIECDDGTTTTVTNGTGGVDGTVGVNGTDGTIELHEGISDELSVDLLSVDEISEEELQFVTELLEATDKSEIVKKYPDKFSKDFLSNIQKRQKRNDPIPSNADLETAAKNKTKAPSVTGATTYSYVNKDFIDGLATQDDNFVSTTNIRKHFRLVHGANKTPVGVYINNEEYEVGDAQNPNETYSWWAKYRTNGWVPSLTSIQNQIMVPSGWDLISYVGIPNATGGTQTVWNTKTIRYEKKTQVSHSSSNQIKAWAKITAQYEQEHTAGLNFGVVNNNNSFKWTFGAEAGTEYIHGWGQSTSNIKTTSTTDTYSYPVEIPPYGRYVVYNFQKVVNVSYDVYANIQFSGYVGSDYGNPGYNGHHFWAIGASGFFSDYHWKWTKLAVEEDLVNAYLVYVLVYDQNNDLYNYYINTPTSDIEGY